MFRNDSTDDDGVLLVGAQWGDPSAGHEQPPVATHATEPTRAYRVKLGRDTVWLPPVEYSILRLLATRPYFPFSRAQIAQAVSSENHPITERSLALHIRSLREKLGFFRDYIQAVPYMGYRFKP